MSLSLTFGRLSNIRLLNTTQRLRFKQSKSLRCQVVIGISGGAIEVSINNYLTNTSFYVFVGMKAKITMGSKITLQRGTVQRLLLPKLVDIFNDTVVTEYNNLHWWNGGQFALFYWLNFGC